MYLTGSRGGHGRRGCLAENGQPMSQLIHGALTQRILGCFFQVHRELGAGFLESVYAKSLLIALGDEGIRAKAEVPIDVYFRGTRVGAFRADMIVESTVLLELKAGIALDPCSQPQMLNYLRATRLEVGLILYFGARATFKRFVMSNEHKLLP